MTLSPPFLLRDHTWTTTSVQGKQPNPPPKADNPTEVSPTLPCIFFFFFWSCRATTTACGGSQARDLIGAVASSLCHSHSNARSKPCLQPTQQLTASGILNLLSKARVRTPNLMAPSQIHFCCATTGTPKHYF